MCNDNSGYYPGNRHPQISVYHCIKESGVVVLYHKYHEGEVFNYDEQKNLQEI